MSEDLKKPRFRIGNLVHHRLFDYRGVVVGVDRDFQGTEEWYEQMARSGPPKDEPWYHVLVAQSNTMTYVAEQNLEEATSPLPITHPLLSQYFSRFEEGSYLTDYI